MEKFHSHVELTFKGPPTREMRACIDQSRTTRLLTLSCDIKVKGQPLNLSDQPFLNTNRVLSKFCDIFHCIGLFPGECTILTGQNFTPFIHPPKRVPLALQDK